MSVLDRYLLKQLLAAFCFYLVICTIVGEVIGISFEQVKFIVEQDLPLKTVLLVHLLKLPSFVVTAFPLALLMTSTSVYSRLSSKNEVAALQSFGVSLIRLILPALAIAFLVSIFMFAVNEAIVPSANYQAAMLLEREWNVDRAKLTKYNSRNIVYQEFEKSSSKKDSKQQRRLHRLFFAEYFDGKEMKGVTLIEYQNAKIEQITIAESARLVKQQQWQFSSGTVYKLNSRMMYDRVDNFEYLYLNLTKNIINYANNNRDDREMNILALYRQLAIIEQTNNYTKTRQLKISIHSRYATSFSCLIFTFLGSTLGLKSKAKTKGNNLGIAAIVIFAYYSTQFLGNSLATTGTITVFIGVWLPNLFNFLIACSKLVRVND